MVTLQRRYGTRTFSTAELTQTLAALRLANQARAYRSTEQLCFLNAGRGLLIADIAVPVNLRLSESFEARPVATNPFGLGFFVAETSSDVNEALQASGYVGAVPLTNLAEAFLAFWDVAAEGVYISQISDGTAELLVDFPGVFGAEPARLRRVAAGDGIHVTVENDILRFSTSLDGRYVLKTIFDPF